MRRVVFDIECDALLDDVTKIHCLAYQWEGETEVKVVTSLPRIKAFFQQENVVFIGHNIIRYDIPVIKKICEVEVDYSKCIDTLAVSWYLEESRKRHGLESYGEEFGNEKVKVDEKEWKEGDLELMIDRCKVDVGGINTPLWENQYAELLEIYGSEKKVIRFLNYISYKMDCLREQEELGWTLDIDRIERGLEKLEIESSPRLEALKSAMPSVPIIGKSTRPKVMYKKDGSLSKAGERWLELLGESGIDEEYEGEVRFVKGYDEPNPNSSLQLKKWLFSLGWKPTHYSYTRNKETGEVKKIEQIKSEFQEGEICQSVQDLMKVEPAIENLGGLSIIKHRIGVLKGFLKNRVGDKIRPGAGGFTKTLRLKHAVIANLPKKNALYAEDIRASLIASEGNVLINSDLAGIEDATKRHYIYPFDPEYVEEMNKPDFDAHIDVAFLAGFINEEQVELYKKLKKEGKKDEDLEDARDKGKLANFSCVYGVGAETMSRSSGLTVPSAKKLIDVYWQRNKAVLEFAETLTVKEIRGKKWIYNPISKFWLPLTADKDKFSAVNQSTGQYVLDLYIGLMRKKYPVIFQYHDELVLDLPQEQVKECEEYQKECVKKLNKILKLHVRVEASFEVGQNYAEVH